ncbi:amidohydrolase family protein [Myxococcota bacterium]|nr:amidohydrolase family protein [Myxococcota bacterium]
MNNTRVIDADGHVFEPESVWETHLDPKYQDRRPRLVRDNRGTTRYMLEGRLIPQGEGMGAWAPEGIFEATTHRDGGFDPKLRLVDMDTEGIDVAVLYGSFGLALWQAQDPAFATALCRAYNDWLTEYCSADPTRLKGIPALPFQDLPRALDEGKRVVRDLDMVGINLLSNMQGRGAHHPSLDPVYALACDLGVPITFHAGGGQFVEPRLDNYAISHTMAFPFDIMYGLACLLCGGVMERFPDLRVAFLEAGCGFFPYFLERLDEHFEKRRGEMPIPRKPSEYVEQGRVLVSCEPDEGSIAFVAESVGADKILYASDYPHWDCEFPDSVHKIRDRPDLDDASKDQILGDNAAAFFGI